LVTAAVQVTNIPGDIKPFVNKRISEAINARFRQLSSALQGHMEGVMGHSPKAAAAILVCSRIAWEGAHGLVFENVFDGRYEGTGKHVPRDLALIRSYQMCGPDPQRCFGGDTIDLEKDQSWHVVTQQGTPKDLEEILVAIADQGLGLEEEGCPPDEYQSAVPPPQCLSTFPVNMEPTAIKNFLGYGESTCFAIKCLSAKAEHIASLCVKAHQPCRQVTQGCLRAADLTDLSEDNPAGSAANQLNLADSCLDVAYECSAKGKQSVKCARPRPTNHKHPVSTFQIVLMRGRLSLAMAGVVRTKTAPAVPRHLHMFREHGGHPAPHLGALHLIARGLQDVADGQNGLIDRRWHCWVQRGLDTMEVAVIARRELSETGMKFALSRPSPQVTAADTLPRLVAQRDLRLKRLDDEISAFVRDFTTTGEIPTAVLEATGIQPMPVEGSTAEIRSSWEVITGTIEADNDKETGSETSLKMAVGGLQFAGPQGRKGGGLQTVELQMEDEMYALQLEHAMGYEGDTRKL